MLYDCCPDRVRGVLDAGATRLGLHASGGPAGQVASLIDHTLLKADATRAEIEKLCREAAEFGFATVCVNPTWVALGARLLAGSRSGVCSVVGFPLGATTPDVKHYETRRAIFDGAREVDMVINIGALKSGDLRLVERDIEAVVAPCRDAGVISKVIIEAALLTDEEKVTASTLTKAAGADFVKTSTGFGPGGATVADVALMRRVVGAEMGVKAAGGVKDFASLEAMVAAGATRVGASAGVRIVQQAGGGTATTPAPSGYLNLAELARFFLWLGAVGFGGPVVHLALLEEHTVRVRRWLTADEFLELLGLTNLIPGPNSTEMAMAIGYKRAGFPGLLVAGACFILPAACLTTLLAWLYVRYAALPWLQPALAGLAPAVIVVMAQGAFRLGRDAVRSAVDVATMIVVCGLALCWRERDGAAGRRRGCRRAAAVSDARPGAGRCRNRGGARWLPPPLHAPATLEQPGRVLSSRLAPCCTAAAMCWWRFCRAWSTIRAGSHSDSCSTRSPPGRSRRARC